MEPVRQKSQPDKLIYRGYFNKVNPKPQGNYILIFASDWNKDYWAFYSYIGQQNWREDIRQINDLIKRLNWRDGDVYVELIDFHDETMRDFYMYLYDIDDWTHWVALNPEQWEKHCPKTAGGQHVE
jgi:hypothetical protein